MTKTMTAEQAKRLVLVRDLMLEIQSRVELRERFDIGTWVTPSEDDPERALQFPPSPIDAGDGCGTVACACGWAATIPELRQAGFTILGGDPWFCPGDTADELEARCRGTRRLPAVGAGVLTGWAAVEAVFGLSRDDADRLFLGESYGCHPHQVAPHQVAERIDEVMQEYTIA